MKHGLVVGKKKDVQVEGFGIRTCEAVVRGKDW